MRQILVRLEGKPEQALEKLIKEGYFKTKSEAVRAGILKLENEYLSQKDGEQALKKIREYFKKNKRSFKEVSDALDALEA